MHFLSSGKVTFISSRTEKDYHMVVQDESELNGYFKRIYVTETSQEDSIDILKGMKQRLVKLYNVEIPNHILKYTVKVLHQYAPGQLPLKAINLLDRTCAMVRQEFSGEVDEVARLRIDIIGLENELASLEDLEETRSPE
ncbi:chaperone protein ClpB1-like protein, partial [Tanacetum coccineum]